MVSVAKNSGKPVKKKKKNITYLYDRSSHQIPIIFAKKRLPSSAVLDPAGQDDAHSFANADFRWANKSPGCAYEGGDEVNLGPKWESNKNIGCSSEIQPIQPVNLG